MSLASDLCPLTPCLCPLPSALCPYALCPAPFPLRPLHNDLPTVLCIIGTSGRNSVTHAVIAAIARRLRLLGIEADVFDPAAEPLPLFNPETSAASPEFRALKARVDRADVFVVATPDYHGSVSSTAKNFLDHFWQEFSGRLFASVVVSAEKGLTATDQLRTIARQCYAWSLPYGISVTAPTDLQYGRVVSAAWRDHLEVPVHAIRV